MSNNQELSQQAPKTKSHPSLKETETVKKQLEQILLTESQLTQMKDDLAKLIDAIQNGIRSWILYGGLFNNLASQNINTTEAESYSPERRGFKPLKSDELIPKYRYH